MTSMLRILSFILAAFFASFATAQEMPCKGRSPVSFPDGGSGCVIGFDKTSVVKERKERGGSSAIRNKMGEWNPARVAVLMQSPYAGSRRRWLDRARYVCSETSPELLELVKGEDKKRFIIEFSWPEEIAPRSAIAKRIRISDSSTIGVRSAMFSSDCRFEGMIENF